MNLEWNACNLCHKRTHDLKDALSDLLKLARRAERGVNVGPQINAKQDRVKYLRAELKAHKELGIDNPHPERETE